MFGIFALFSGGQSFWEELAAWYEKSLLNELLTYFRERYFTVEFGAYENFSVSPGMGVTVRNIIVAIAVGLIVAFVMTAYFRLGLGKFVRKLLEEDCDSPAKAKNLMELGFFQSTMIRRELTRGGSLRMVVHQCEESLEEGVGEAVPDTTGELSAESAAEEVAEGGSEGDATDQTPVEEAVTEASEAETPEAETPEAEEEKAEKLPEKVRKIDFLTARFYIPRDLRARAELRFEKKGSSWGMVVLASVLTIVGAGLLCWLLPDIVQFADNIISVFAP